MAIIKLEGIGAWGNDVLTHVPAIRTVIRWGRGFIKLKEMADTPVYTYHRTEIVEIDLVDDSCASIVSAMNLFEEMEKERG